MTPSFDGTLAAARCLGERGIRVTVAGQTRLAPAQWSRYVSRRVSCPEPFEANRFVDWLLDFGRREPGHVLYPTCDDLAWLLAHHSEVLAEHFLLYQPPAESVLSLLDKKALSLRAQELGVPTPRTVFPQNAEDAVALAEQVGFPLLVKPRTQIFLATRNKGEIAESREMLEPLYSRFVRENRPHPLVQQVLPAVDQPMLQELIPNAAMRTYSLAGFIGRDGEGMAVRAAVKLMQRPPRIGVGVCFEEAPVDAAALDGIKRLCESVGYFGVFEAEFVLNGDQLLLVDFNPRYYGQMAFEQARSLHLPYLAWLGSLGEREKLAEALARAQAWQSEGGYVYCNRFLLDSTLFLQGLFGRISKEEQSRWRKWRDRPRAFDAMQSSEDPWPALVSKVSEVYAAFRHPRSFYRKVIVGSSTLAFAASEALMFL